MRSSLLNPFAGRRESPSSERSPLRVRTYSAGTVAECLALAKKELGVDALILSKRTFRKGGWFGRWGGREIVELTFGTTPPAWERGDVRLRLGSKDTLPESIVQEAAQVNSMQKLEAQIASLTASVQNMVETGKKSFVAAPVQTRMVGRHPVESISDNAGYPSLLKQLLEAEIAAPLARQLISTLPAGLSVQAAAEQMRTVLSQRLKVSNRTEVLPGGKMRLLAFVGTTGVGKSTTIAKLAAQYSLVEHRKIGIVTLDTQRIAAAQQLQTYGEILRVPVMIAHDKAELVTHLSHFAAEGMELVLVDTAGRSPNETLPLGETAHLFEGMGAVQKFLAIPATLGVRDMENIVTRFQSILAPDALILTKLDEASDSTCFGKLLTIQAKYGLPLAYITTGQKVPDDIAFPDSHAIAARIVTTAAL